MLSSRKIRSLVDAKYTKQYQRITYQIDPIQGMSTDLSKSYLALRMFIVNDANINETLNKADYAALLAQNLMISFGQNGQSYTPACLFKVARLYDGNNNILEEILFQNVLRATLAQVCGDIETVSSNTLSSSTSLSMNPNGSLAAQISALLLNPNPGASNMAPLEVHILLSDLFGIARNSNFHLEMTSGLVVELELEDQKKMFQVVPVGNPLAAIVPDTTFKYSPEMNPWNVLPVGQGDVGQPSYTYANAVMAGNGLHFDKSSIVGDWLTGASGAFNVITLSGLYAADSDLSNVNIQVGNLVKVNFLWTDPNTATPTQQNTVVSYWSQITDIAFGAVNASTFTIATNLERPAPVYGATSNMVLDSFDVYVSDETDLPVNTSLCEALYLNGVNGATTTDADWDTFTKTSQIAVTSNVAFELSTMGIINAIDTGLGTVRYEAGTVPFDLVVNKLICTVDTPIYQIPWTDQFVNADSPTQRSMYIGSSKTIPIQGGGAQIASVVASGGDYIITFINLGLANNNSIQNAALYKDASGYDAQIVRNGTTGIAGVTGGAVINTSFLIAKHRNGLAPPFPILNATTTNSQLVVGQQYMIYDVGTTSDAQWQSLGLKPATGTPTVAAAGMLFTVPDGAPTTGLGDGFVFQYSKYTTQPLSFMIDKCELVLVESAIDPALPMSMVYSTFKVEVNTIQSETLSQFNYQYVITEPNVVNAYLICPQYSATADGKNPESLIGNSRNVNEYRWSINNIEQTNRNVVVQSNTSKYPSSLHISMLMDTFENSEMVERSISGLLTVPRSVKPPVLFPLRLYQGMDDMNFIMKPTGCTAQIQFYGDSVHNQNLIQGSIFFFKEMLKVLPVSQRM